MVVIDFPGLTINFMSDRVVVFKLMKKLEQLPEHQLREMQEKLYQLPSVWVVSTVWEDFKFEWEFFNGPFVQMCNVIEAVFGRWVEERFIAELRKELMSIIEGLLRT